MPEAAEFNIRGKKTKYYTQKEIDEMASKREIILKKQELLMKERQKLTQLEQQPKSMSNVAGGGAKRQEANELMYIGTGAQDIEIELA